MKVIAKKPFNYGGKKRNIGDVLDMSGRDANIFCAIGKAVKYTEPPPILPAFVPSYERRDMAAEEEPVKKKRQYKRRDMTVKKG